MDWMSNESNCNRRVVAAPRKVNITMGKQEDCDEEQMLLPLENYLKSVLHENHVHSEEIPNKAFLKKMKAKARNDEIWDEGVISSLNEIR